jgi:hypothetical protein
METVHPLERHKYVDMQAVLEENHQLRELVIHLSKLVIKNVVDRK